MKLFFLKFLNSHLPAKDLTNNPPICVANFTMDFTREEILAYLFY
jgi:hypothetical protein